MLGKLPRGEVGRIILANVQVSPLRGPGEVRARVHGKVGVFSVRGLVFMSESVFTVCSRSGSGVASDGTRD